jgi:adenosylcobinamide-phosphate synthase
VFLLLAFLVAHLLIGALLPYRREYRPALWKAVHAVAGALGRKLNRRMRKERQLSGRGFVALALLGLAGFGLDFLLKDAARMAGKSWLYAFPLMAVSLSGMMPVKVMREVATRLEKKQNTAAARALQPYRPEDLSQGEEHLVVRKALEFGALSFMRYFVAPCFYFLALGTTGLSLYVVVIAAGEAWELLRQEHFTFARWARAAEKLLNIIPALLTLFMLSLASLFVSRANSLRAVKIAATQGARFSSLSRGIVVGAMAGSLGVTLGGPAKYRGSGIPETHWIGPEGSSARLNSADIKRGRMLIFVAFLCAIAFLATALMVKIRFS